MDRVLWSDLQQHGHSNHTCVIVLGGFLACQPITAALRPP